MFVFSSTRWDKSSAQSLWSPKNHNETSTVDEKKKKNTKYVKIISRLKQQYLKVRPKTDRVRVTVATWPSVLQISIALLSHLNNISLLKINPRQHFTSLYRYKDKLWNTKSTKRSTNLSGNPDATAPVSHPGREVVDWRRLVSSSETTLVVLRGRPSQDVESI